MATPWKYDRANKYWIATRNGCDLIVAKALDYHFYAWLVWEGDVLENVGATHKGEFKGIHGLRKAKKAAWFVAGLGEKK